MRLDEEQKKELSKLVYANHHSEVYGFVESLTETLTRERDATLALLEKSVANYANLCDELSDSEAAVVELTRERDEARAEAAGYLSQLQEDPLAKQLAVAEAAVAGAYRLAADIQFDEPTGCSTSIWSGLSEAAKHAIRRLTPSAAIRAEKRLVAQAVLDTVEGFHRVSTYGEDNHVCRISFYECRELAAAKAALAAIEKETKDA